MFLSWHSDCISSLGHPQTQMEQNKMHLKGRSRQGRVPPATYTLSYKALLKSLKLLFLATPLSSGWESIHLCTRSSPNYFMTLFPTFNNVIPSLPIKPRMVENREKVETVSPCWDRQWPFPTEMCIIQWLENYSWEQMINNPGFCEGPGSAHYQLSKWHDLGRQTFEQS